MQHANGPAKGGRHGGPRRLWALLAAAALVPLSAPAQAGEASVLDATVEALRGGTYAISATVNHMDEGWSHYADRWEVLTPDGRVAATRVLYHPHVDEQPFTRSLGRIQVPIGVREVTVRANCSVHGPGERTFTLTLPPRR